jgi:hypothetical protein
MQQYWYNRSKPFGTVLGHAGGIGGFARPRVRSVSGSEQAALETAGMPMPYGFTGRWHGVLYYKGQRWTGPSNAMGRR